jgi:IMP cyclohydrolase
MVKNPCLPYPGRQIFVGTTFEGLPAFGYLVTGRSPESQQRKAVYKPEENSVRIVPLDPSIPFDELRHYQAVRIDPETKTVVVSNSQAPVADLLESYKAVAREGREIESGLLSSLLGMLGPEPDSINTPRIAAVLAKTNKDHHFRSVHGIVNSEGAAAYFDILQNRALFRTVSTYRGDLELTPSFGIEDLHAEYALTLGSKTPQELSEELYEISFVENPRGDLRVCTVAGVLTGHRNWPGGWEIAVKNRHNVE